MSGYQTQNGWPPAAPYGAQSPMLGYQQGPPAQYAQYGQYPQQPPYSQQYGAPPPQLPYGAPPQGYGAPTQNYGAPPLGYGSPHQPQQSYGSASPPGYGSASPPPQDFKAPLHTHSTPPVGASPPPPGGAGTYRPSLGVITGASAKHYNPSHDTRPRASFRLGAPGDALLNGPVLDGAGRAPFSVKTEKKRTVVSGHGGEVLAEIDWDHSSPRLVYRGEKKIKLKEWIPLKENKSFRQIKYLEKKYRWIARDECVLLELAEKPGYPYAVCRNGDGGSILLEVFQEALDIAGLLEMCVVGVVAMQSGKKLGDEDDASTDEAVGSIGALIGTLIAFNA